MAGSFNIQRPGPTIHKKHKKKRKKEGRKKRKRHNNRKRAKSTSTSTSTSTSSASASPRHQVAPAALRSQSQERELAERQPAMEQRVYRPSDRRGSETNDADRYKVFVGGLAWSTTETTLAAAFSRFGDLLDARVIMEREDPTKSRGFGFVSYGGEAAMRSAIEDMDGADLEGRPLSVNQAQARGARGDSARGGGGGGGGGGERGYSGDGRRKAKYAAAARDSMTVPVEQERSQDDAARMEEYLRRKAARAAAAGR